MKLGSLFDGSGGFPLAGTLCGIEPVWAAEVEPYPIAVTRSRFPNMKHLGDISKINGAEIEPVDIITFGSPCQDLSVAGKRAGLKHEDNGDEETTRSGLFMEAIRIIKEMREATNGIYPTVILWENVPGAFSSNKGEDFKVVLEEIVKIKEPTAVMPEVPQGGWAYADCYRGDGWSLAYRVFDAQYWGVPQRRRRIYLVADFRGECAKEILFERQGLRGCFEAGRTPWQNTSADAEDGIGADDRAGAQSNTAFRRGKNQDSQSCLRDRQGSDICRRERMGSGLTPTETNGPGVGDIHTEGFDGYNGCLTGKVSSTLGINSCTATGRNGVLSFHLLQDPISETDITPCLSAGNSDRGQACVGVVEQYLFENHSQDARYSGIYGGGSENLAILRYIVRRLTPTECARLQGFADQWGRIEKKKTLTDDEYRFWLEVRNTHAAINGKAVKEYAKKQVLTWYNKLWTDSAECKMWGNGIALPTALYCMQGISDVLGRRRANGQQ